MSSLNKKRKDKGTGLAASSSVGTLKGNAPGKVNRGGGVKGTKSEYLILPPSLMKRQPAEIFALGSMSNIEDSDDETSDRDLPINYHMRRHELKERWLVIVALVNRLSCLETFCKQNFEAIHERVAQSRHRYMFMVKAVTFVIKRVHWIRVRLARRKEIFRKHGWRIVLHWKCRKRKEAVRAVREFFMDHKNFRLAYMMLRFRSNALALQRRVRNFIQVNNARVFVLTKLWIKIEKRVRDSMLPKVKQLQIDQNYQKHAESIKCEAWEATKLTGVVLPSLANQVNTCTRSAILLKKIINEGKEIQIKVSNAEMNRRIKHMKDNRKLGQLPKAKRKKRKKKTMELVDTMSVRERMIRTFLSECRREFKAEQSHDSNKSVEKAVTVPVASKIPTDLALKLIKSKNLADMRSIEASIQELMVAEAETAQHLRIYTGENAGKFYCLVEEYVKRKIDEMIMMC